MKTTDATSDALGPEFLPLRGLANILTVLLAVVVLSQEKLSVVMG